MLSSLNGLGTLKFPQIYLTLAHNPITFVPTPEIGSKMQMSCPHPQFFWTALAATIKLKLFQYSGSSWRFLIVLKDDVDLYSEQDRALFCWALHLRNPRAFKWPPGADGFGLGGGGCRQIRQPWKKFKMPVALFTEKMQTNVRWRLVDFPGITNLFFWTEF